MCTSSSNEPFYMGFGDLLCTHEDIAYCAMYAQDRLTNCLDIERNAYV